jgi:hypothetical protein
MNMTPFQLDSLRCDRKKLADSTGLLEKLESRVHNFQRELLLEKQRADVIRAELLETNLPADGVSKLLVCERRGQLLGEFLSRAADEVTSLRLAVLGELRQFEKLYVEIFPVALHKPASQLPPWAGEGCGAVDRGRFAIQDIDRLLE